MTGRSVSRRWVLVAGATGFAAGLGVGHLSPTLSLPSGPSSDIDIFETTPSIPDIPASLADGQVRADDGYTYTDIQAAQDAATEYLFVGPGTFGPLTIDTPGLVVEGVGPSAIIANEEAPAVDIRADCILRNFAHEVTSGAGSGLDNVFDGNAPEPVDVICANLAVAGSAKADAYHFESGGRVRLTDCRSRNVAGESVELAGVEAEIVGGRYERGRIKASSGATLRVTGVEVVASGGGTLPKGFELESAMGEPVEVTSCLVAGADRGAELQAGGCVFSNNRIVDCEEESIFVNQGQDSAEAEGRVAGNVLLGDPANGHWVTGPDGPGNVVFGDNSPPYEGPDR